MAVRISSHNRTKKRGSDEHPFFPIVLTELFRRTILLFLEYPVEIRQIVEATFVTDLSDCHRGIHQKPCRISQPDIYDIVRQTLPGPELEEAAESHIRHPYHLGQIVQADLFLIMSIDVMLHFLDPAAVGLHLNLGE